MSILRLLCLGFIGALSTFTLAQNEWFPLTVGSSVQTITTLGTDIYVSSIGNGVLKSINDGANWTPMNTGLPTLTGVRSIGRTGNDDLLVGHNDGIFRSSDEGATWTLSNTGVGVTTAGARKFFYIHGITYALYSGTISEGGGIYRSTNNGVSWTIGHVGMSTNMNVRHLAYTNWGVFAATSNGIMRSFDDGATWQPLGGANYNTYSLQFIGDKIIALTDFGMLWTENYGGSWQGPGTGLPTQIGKGELILYDGKLFAIMGTSFATDVFRSFTEGATWETFMTGMADIDQGNQNQFHASADKLFLGALSDGYWLPGTSVAVDDISSANVLIHPTVFNDGFTVDLSGMSSVSTIVLIDASGKECARHPGLAATPVRLDRGTLASGIYDCMVMDQRFGEMRSLGKVIAQ